MMGGGIRVVALGAGLALYTAVGVVCLLLAVGGEGLRLADVISALAAAYAATRIACALAAPVDDATKATVLS